MSAISVQTPKYTSLYVLKFYKGRDDVELNLSKIKKRSIVNYSMDGKTVSNLIPDTNYVLHIRKYLTCYIGFVEDLETHKVIRVNPRIEVHPNYMLSNTEEELEQIFNKLL
jgi:hypothetical protein